MTYLFLRSYFMLIVVDVALRSAGLKSAYTIVRKSKIKLIAGDRRVPYERICRAMDLACVFYSKTVLCLQRSVACVAVLRAYGWPAELVTGCSIGTFENHAWAELNGAIVNDKPYMHEMYQVLDRC
jgi:hypothetical protein